MSRILLEKPIPGATTCVLVGDATALDRSRLHHFRHLLWLTDRDSVQRARPVLPRHAIETTIVDEAPARSVVEQFLRRDPRHLPSVFVSDIILTQHSDAYRRALAELETTLESHHHSRAARQKDGFIWQKRLFENLGDYATHRLPAEWSGLLEGLPALIIADPSTEIPSDLHARFAETVIFAPAASLPTLARQHIAADFALAIDGAGIPKSFPSSKSTPTRVVLSPLSDPAWPRAIADAERYYLSARHPTIDWLSTQGIASPPIAVAADYIATALALARFLRCSPIQVLGEKDPTPQRTTRTGVSRLKTSRLAALQSAEPPPPAVLLAARNRVRLAAMLGRTQSTEIRRMLASRTPEATAFALRQLFKDQTFANVFGTFSLKLAPHLVPPVDANPALWHTLLDELAELAETAAQ